MLSRILALIDMRGMLTVDELVRATGFPRAVLDGMLDTLQRRRLIERRRGEVVSGCVSHRIGSGAVGAAAPVVTLRLPEKTTPPAGPGAKGQPKPGEGRGKPGHPVGQSSRR